MLVKFMEVEMAVLRLCRTFPRKTIPGIGLQPFYCSELSKFDSIVFTKWMNEEPIKKTEYDLIQVGYSDYRFKSLNTNFFAAITKVWGEIRMLMAVSWFLLARRPKVEVIHCHSIHYAITAVLLGRCLRVPVVLSIGGTDVRRAANIHGYKYILRQFACVVHVASSHERLIDCLMPGVKRLHVANGLDGNIFFDKHKKRKKQLLCVGNVRWQKGYDDLMEAANLIFSDYPDYKLLIVGKYDVEACDALKSKISPIFRSKVHFLGVLDQKRINTMMNESRVFLLPSVSEGLPKVILECQAAGLPVVTTDVGDCAEISNGAGLVVPPGQPQKFAAAVVRLIQDKKLYQRCKEGCYKNSKNYSWDDLVRKIDEAYSELLGYD